MTENKREIPFYIIGQTIESVDYNLLRGDTEPSGEYVNVRVRLRYDDPQIKPDYWVEVIDDSYGREHEIRASYLKEAAE